jgi:hypothetical protein
MTPDTLITHLERHLPYKLLMLRHTHRQLSREQDQLNWNANLESFAAHARGFKDFLTNDGGGSNMKVRDYVPDYKAPARQQLHGIINKLDYEIFHLGKNRPRDPEKQFNSTNADEVFQWIEDAMARFVSLLSPEYRAHWNEEGARLPEAGTGQISREPRNSPPTRTSFPTTSASGYYSPVPRSSK